MSAFKFAFASHGTTRMSNGGSLLPFVGDDKYPGDGGDALQTLWQTVKWKEIKNCPGRYTSPDVAARSESPRTFLKRAGVASAVGSSAVQVPNKDAFALYRLSGGGGLLTYCRPEENLFVHTFNTESGLTRKIDALGSSLMGVVMDGNEPAEERAALDCCLVVLPFLLDKEKNASAYALIRALRRTARNLQ
eukprot:TRINITY_DN16284_c0_g1_i1.p1 TRINITY_DN16284_c0_g1~~TRINITY_DN16284_c0_g1_i1.p1  ORF type:complete len:191 (+),score=35.77 TRINITY_DN16284_c0_g1_i1:25-597(+)